MHSVFVQSFDVLSLSKTLRPDITQNADHWRYLLFCWHCERRH